ncbi:hypothetical protein LCGC14_1065210 [marine sediment metagenome]|uniref:Uncharacterized protein n=1 Tax=marine sediment metagenome TaxID=412755 RepID=A0A0F9MPM9_9ZZZZ
MLTRVSFKRCIRSFNRCLTVTIPKHIVDSLKLERDQEYEFTMLIDIPKEENNEKKDVPIIAV